MLLSEEQTVMGEVKERVVAHEAKRKRDQQESVIKYKSMVSRTLAWQFPEPSPLYRFCLG